MPLDDFVLTKGDFHAVEWKTIIADCDTKTCEHYSDLLFAKAREAEAAGDMKAYQVLSFLGAITSPMLHADSRDEPFGPMFEFHDRRGIIPSDLTQGHLQSLRNFVPGASDPELRSRAADILWLRDRDFQMANLAVEAYLESAKLLEDGTDWLYCAERLRRALNLAASLGKGDSFRRAVSHIEEVLNRLDGTDPLYLSAKLMEVLQQYRQGDPLKYAMLAEKAGKSAEAAADWPKARSYWEAQARWHKLAKRPDDEEAALLRAAETYVEEAKMASPLVATFHLRDAIEALRRIPGTKPRRDELHSQLLVVQQRSVREMHAVTTEVDIGAITKRAADSVKGRGIGEAIFTLALLGRSPKLADLRAYAEELVSKFPLQHLVSGVMVDDTGKTVARKESIEFGSPEGMESAIKEEMWRHAATLREIHAVAIVQPAREQIYLEHDIRLSDFLDIVHNNPLVPAQRESIYAQGLYYGMKGDFLLAAHLLIPQFENSIRCMLQRHGIVTSGLDSQGVQEEQSLNQTLVMPELAQILHEDIIFDLRGLLVERFGSNLRNLICHGLIAEAVFSSPQVVYLWWIILQQCCLPLINLPREEPDAAQEEE